jgi:hypothetical protein
MNVKPPSTVRDTFRWCLLYGLNPIPGQPRSKETLFTGQGVYKVVATPKHLDVWFPEHVERNIGITNGELSGNLCDLDLDSAVAVKLAPALLPSTDWRFHRPNTDASAHRLYRTTDRPFPKSTEEYRDPATNTKFFELRGSNHWSIWPPSIHPSGARITWDGDVDDTGPPRGTLAGLEKAAGKLAAACALTSAWPGEKSNRHHLSLAVAGGLLRGGWSVEEVEKFVEAVASAAGDEEVRDRVRNVQGTFEKIQHDEHVTGWPSLAELLGEKGGAVVTQVRAWLGLAESTGRNGRASPPPWPEPIPLDEAQEVPEFPVDLLPRPLREWVRCEAEATQTPPDLAAMLGLTVSAAGLAGKAVVRVRQGWAEPANLYAVNALPPGERKSAVFRTALAPVADFERSEVSRQAPVIAEAATERRQLEARLKSLEGKVAKCDDSDERASLKREAAEAARALAAHKVPAAVRLFVDDVTPEKLAQVLAEQGGRMLQASAEGNLFEVAKGRYSEGARPTWRCT